MRRPGRRRTRPEPLGALVPSLLDDLGFESTRVLTQIVERWAELVGDRAAVHTRPAAVRGAVLELDADSSVWVQTLRLRSPEILEKLHAALGVEAPRELWIRIGRPARDA
jgi:predicted nucleic acid-binding Zn ribbon protein